MRTIWILGLCVVLSAGCKHMPPLEIKTDLGIGDEPIQGEINANLDTTPDLKPLEEVAVEPEALCHAGCKIAIIDVDGLLLNMNLVGPYSGGENPVTLFQEKLRMAGMDPAVRAVVLRIR